MDGYNLNPDFWRKKKVLITGHNGFKGSWLCVALNEIGSNIYGISLPPETNPSMYQLVGLDRYVSGLHADIRDFEKTKHIDLILL